MNTSLSSSLLDYIETPPSVHRPVKIDIILAARLRAFIEARRNNHSATRR